MSAAPAESPIPVRRDRRRDRCACAAHASPFPSAHAPGCVGSHPTGWRARVPEIPELFAEYERVQCGEPRSVAPIFRELAMRHAMIARFGKALR